MPASFRGARSAVIAGAPTWSVRDAQAGEAARAHGLARLEAWRRRETIDEVALVRNAVAAAVKAPACL